MYVVIGNIIALVASIIMVYTGILKSKKKIIYFQTIQLVLFVISNIILGGISGAIINAISCIRNILCYKNRLNALAKIFISVASIILIIFFNNLGIVGLMPLIATLSYIWLMTIKDIKKFKYLTMFNMLLWLIYDLYIKSYTSAIFDFLNIIANFVSIMKIKK